jgi:signal transduction histidine kinase
VASIPHQTIDASSLEQAIGTLQQRLDTLKSALAQQQKLATLGMVTAVIAHEFNNILTPMISYTQYALSNKSDDALREKALQKALLGAERAVAISKSLLGFAKGDDSTSANIKQCVAESLNCLSREPAKDGINLTVDVEPDLTVAMNAGQFQQVLMNLIVNARSAMVTKGRAGGRRLTIRAGRSTKGRAQISVADTGPGIDPTTQKRIFEPFFSTKPADTADPLASTEPRGGTGLGLTICQELLAAADATIRVESELGNGATFIIDLPIAAPPAAVNSALPAKVA